ncbi:MAG: hypothetical protein AAFU33_13030 [Bacteroidota bacterium]
MSLATYKESFLKVLRYFPKHWEQEKHWGYYITMLAFLGISMYINYFWVEGTTIERLMVSKFRAKEVLILWYMLFYGIPYVFGLVAYAAFHQRWDLLKNPQMWTRALFVIFVLSFDAAFYYHYYAYRMVEGMPERYWARKVAGNFNSVLAMWLPLFLYWYFRDRKQMGHLYGLTFKNYDYRPYVILLLLMVPLVVGASFTEDFIRYYPTLKHRIVKDIAAVPLWFAYVIYEIAYASDFIWTELVFRGFMVIGMAQSLGAASVGAMAGVYCYRHFAKPMGEAGSSIFGGYILGVIALGSRNIQGGVYVHMGIALLMELSAFLQFALRP